MEKKNCSISIRFFYLLDNQKKMKKFLDQTQLYPVLTEEDGDLAIGKAR